MPAERVVLMGLMSPNNEVPAIPGLNASGFGAVTVYGSRMPNGTVTSAEVIFDTTYTGFSEGTNFTGFHIHLGAAGTNGPVTINTGLTGPLAAVPAGGSLHYEVLDNPDILVEIADWDSAEVRAAAMQQAMADGAYAPLEELLAAPFRATVLRQLS